MNKIYLIAVIVLVILVAVVYFSVTARRVEAPRELNTPIDSLPTIIPNDQGSPSDTNMNQPVSQMSQEAVVEAAKLELATKLKIDAKEISALEVTARDWPDACLGLAGPDELCAEVITSGYLVVLKAQNREYRYRTNLDGTLVRIEP